VRIRLSDTLRPLQAKRSRSRAYNGFGNIGSEEPSIVVGTGSAVSPVFPSACLRRVTGKTDPTIVPPSTVYSVPVSCQAWFSDRARFGRSFPGTHQAREPRRFRPVSQTTGVSAVPHT
jgi:hypothetical protein